MNACELKKCTSYIDGVCHYESIICKYQEVAGNDELQFVDRIGNKERHVDSNGKYHIIHKETL